MGGRGRRALGVLLVVAAILFVWELLKFVGGDPWRIGGFFWNPPFRFRIANDQSLPHVWNVFGTLFSPIQPDGPILAAILFGNMLYTLRGAALGFALGAGFGLLLGIL